LQRILEVILFLLSDTKGKKYFFSHVFYLLNSVKGTGPRDFVFGMMDGSWKESRVAVAGFKTFQGS
jgi:hypothetical protein